MDENNEQSCETCYQIVCKRCDWVANKKEVTAIQCGLLISCPVCGWKPGDIM